MYKVYWTVTIFDDEEVRGEEIATLEAALDFTRHLRNQGYKFVTMVSENPNCVSLTGANGMDAKDYEWKKRR